MGHQVTIWRHPNGRHRELDEVPAVPLLQRPAFRGVLRDRRAQHIQQEDDLPLQVVPQRLPGPAGLHFLGRGGSMPHLLRLRWKPPGEGTQQQQLRVSSAMFDVVATILATVVDSTVTTDVIAVAGEPRLAGSWYTARQTG